MPRNGQLAPRLHCSAGIFTPQQGAQLSSIQSEHTQVNVSTAEDSSRGDTPRLWQGQQVLQAICKVSPAEGRIGLVHIPEQLCILRMSADTLLHLVEYLSNCEQWFALFSDHAKLSIATETLEPLSLRSHPATRFTAFL